MNDTLHLPTGAPPPELIATPWKDANAKRLIRRFRRHQNELFTLLDQAGVPFNNNHAERSIRPAVIIPT